MYTIGKSSREGYNSIYKEPVANPNTEGLDFEKIHFVKKHN